MLKLLVIYVVIGIIQGDQWFGPAISYQRINQTHFNSKPTNSRGSTGLTEVCTKVGCVRGKVENGRRKSYEAFYGIPYAEPPVGKLRLENPVPHKGWEGHWDATYARSDCIQRNFFLHTQPILGSEDCLHLNVYRPVERKEKLPVFIFIHGGGYRSFSGSPRQFGPEYLMDTQEVILVTMNYRLGMFGFLCSGDGVVKGNFGLKDQQLALKWVATNIEAFGGDPDAITLGGQSVGAASTQHHLMNPDSQVLFHRAMVMSGSALSYWSLGNDSSVKFRQSAQYSGMKDWQTASTLQLAKQFKKLDAYTLILAHDRLYEFILAPPIALRPCIEGDWEGAFLKEDPKVTWAEGKFPQKPILFGMVEDEGIFAAAIPTNSTQLMIFNENINRLLPIQLDIDPKYTKDVLDFYLNGKNYIDETNVKSYYKMIGDRIFYHQVINSIIQYRLYADTHSNLIHIYKFAYEGPETFVMPITGKDINLGVCHLDDLIYLFTMEEFFRSFEPNSPEGKMSDVFIRTLVDFIVKGEAKAWTKFESCTMQTSEPFCDYQVFSRNKKMHPDSVLVTASRKFDKEMVEFWDRIESQG